MRVFRLIGAIGMALLPLLSWGQTGTTSPTGKPSSLSGPLPESPQPPEGMLRPSTQSPPTGQVPQLPSLGPEVESEAGLGTQPGTEEEVLHEEVPVEAETVLPLFGHDIFAETAEEAPPLLETVAPPPPSYILGPGDEVELRVWGRGIDYVPPSLQVISNDGAIFGPNVGRIPLAGKTIAEAREGILFSYRRYYPECEVSLVLGRLRSIEVMVLGDVVRPGRKILPGTSTVFTALYAAGGPLESGALRHIELRRGPELVSEIDLYDLLLRGHTPSDLALQSGDIVFVHVIGPIVTIQGEVRRPARYEIRDRTTLAEALDMAGGIRGSALARRIQLLRSDEHQERIIVEADLVNEPEKWRNVELIDGDEINVLPVLEDLRNAITVEGAVRRPGDFAWHEGMTVSQALEAAEGVTPEGAVRSIQVLRESPAGSRDLLTVDLVAIREGQVADVVLQPRDIVRVSNLQEVAPPVVYIEGAVNLPGLKDFYRGMTVGDLIRAAGGLTTDAYGEAATLIRKNEAFEDIYLAVPIGKIVGGAEGADIPLQTYDRLIVASVTEKGREKFVEIAGAVANPGEYPVGAGIYLSDLVRLAGGLLPEASGKATILRGQVAGTVETQVVDIAPLRGGRALEADVLLQEGDTVSVEGRGGFSVKAEFVEVKGQVARPAAYPLLKPDGSRLRISELLALAGGLLPTAYPKMAVIYQTQKSLETRTERVANIKTALHDSTTLPAEKKPEEEAEAAAAEPVPEAEVPSPASTGSEPTVVKSQVRLRSAGQAKQLYLVLQGVQGEAHIIIPPRVLADIPISNGVPVDLTRVLKKPGGPADIELQDGDILTVFCRPDTVMVDGAVAAPGPHPFIEHRTVADYLWEAGHFTRDADRNHIVVVHYNGQAVRAKMDQRIETGDWIIVPTRYVTQTVGQPSEFQQTLNRLLEAVGTFLLFRKL
ncbi:MAG: SLBB domain-containing protein [Candidatus Zipacnadales bacterium]